MKVKTKALLSLLGLLYWGLLVLWRWSGSDLWLGVFVLFGGVGAPAGFMFAYLLEVRELHQLERSKDLRQRANEKQLVTYLRGKFTFFFRNAVSLMVSTAGLLGSIRRVQESTGHQSEQAQEVARSVTTLNQGLEEIGENAEGSLEQAERSLEAALAGAEAVEDHLAGMARLIEMFGTISQEMNGLQEDSKGITEVMNVISNISSQTNLLSLNAAIEAAKAGEQGRGFSIVADEVRNLAQKTQASSEEIALMVEKIQGKTRRINAQLQEGTERLSDGQKAAQQVGTKFAEILEQIRESRGRIEKVAGSLVSQNAETERIERNIASLGEHVQTIHQSVGDAAETIRQLGVMGEGLLGHLAEYRLETRCSKVIEGLKDLAARVARELAQAEQQGVKIWDRNYRPLEGTDPQKYAVSYLDWIDKAPIQSWQDQFQREYDVVFTALIDQNGYLPKHNSQFDHPPTGDRQTDLGKSRSRRLFDDFTGLRAGKNTNPVMMQVYMRDTGEVMVDLSVPVWVGSTHWGAMRLGFMPEEDLLEA